MGHKIKNQFLTQLQKDEICVLGQSGILHKDIAKMFDIHVASVSRILVAAGITRYWTKNVWRRKHKGLL